MRLGLLVFTPALLAAASPVSAAQTSVAGRPATSVRPAAISLARVLNNEALIIRSMSNEGAAVAVSEQLAAANPDIAAHERTHPGIARALANAMLPIIVRSARERLPKLWNRQARLYSGAFTDSELATLERFYESSAGQKLIIAVGAAEEPDAVLAGVIAFRDYAFGMNAEQKNAVQSLMAMPTTVNAVDEAALITFARTGLQSRLMAVMPDIQDINSQWFDEEAPWQAAESERAAVAVLARFNVGASK